MNPARQLSRRRASSLAREAKRAARKVRFPVGFKGTVMWCPKCYAELHRIPEGSETEAHEQQRIVDEHRAACKPKSRAV